TRFDIHSHEIKRDDTVGGMCRTVFQAWFHSEDVAKPVCIVTINEHFADFVEWIHVDELFRRTGIATEVMQAIEGVIPGITLDGATEAGEAFCDEYERRFPSCPMG
ncbi:MAG: hypothetical protein WBD31_13630, partial [Rubripirellula sp.]